MTDNNSTLSPTATPNKCQELEAGDIAIFSVTSDDPDIIALFPLVDIYPEVDALYITDNPWNGTHLLTTESTIQVCRHLSSSSTMTTTTRRCIDMDLSLTHPVS